VYEAKAFIVEDDDQVRRTLRDLMETGGFDVEDFSNAGDFLRALAPVRPGVVIMDLCLPDVSGLELLDRVLKIGRARLPVVIITGYSDVPTAVEAIKRGAVDFLEKPFKPDRLLEAAREALDTIPDH